LFFPPLAATEKPEEFPGLAESEAYGALEGRDGKTRGFLVPTFERSSCANSSSVGRVVLAGKRGEGLEESRERVHSGGQRTGSWWPPARLSAAWLTVRRKEEDRYICCPVSRDVEDVRLDGG